MEVSSFWGDRLHPGESRTSRDSRRGHGINARWWWGLPVGTGRGPNVALDAKPERIASSPVVPSKGQRGQPGLFDERATWMPPMMATLGTVARGAPAEQKAPHSFEAGLGCWAAR